VRHVERSGPYSRVCDPSWTDPLDATFAARHGGRWNAPGSFGVLHLNATIAVAAANARRNYDGEIATLFDLRPEHRPDLQLVDVQLATFVDVVTPAGVRAVRLPAAFPYGVQHDPCRRIGARAYAARENGIATRSNADATATTFVGEELAAFDTALALARRMERLPFARWYPVETPQREPQA
jgi:RES domain-containing protein